MPRSPLLGVLTGAPLVWCSACSPALDWREVRPEGSALLVMFPCKPTSQARSAALAGAQTRMSLYSCSAAGMTFALAFADLGDPARVTPALTEMRTALAANLGSQNARSLPFEVKGMTPNPQAVQLTLQGQLPDETPTQERAALFAHGTHVYQAVVLGPKVADSAAALFFEGLRLPA